MFFRVPVGASSSGALGGMAVSVAKAAPGKPSVARFIDLNP
jgi:hypothetical protein